LIVDEFEIEQVAWWIGHRWDWGYEKIKGLVKKWKRLPRSFECEQSENTKIRIGYATCERTESEN
jgi:hypothetical protein